MQAFSAEWVPPTGVLGVLTQAAHERAGAEACHLGEWRARAADRAAAPVPLGPALRGPHVRVIAEVKRASPSKGAIAPGLDAATQARAYEAGGAAAVSVLTEPTRFGGCLEDLSAAAAAVRLPVIRKDFVVHPVQLWEAAACGASAALLIVRALDPEALTRLMGEAPACGLDLLVEVRDEAELDRALGAGASVVGVNNRNLETLVIDPDTAARIIPLIPRSCVAVAESGMSARADVEPVARAGADAILVGSAVSQATDPTAAVRALASVASGPGLRPG